MLGVAAALAALATIAFVALARGSYDTLPRAELPHGAPAWARPCLRTDPPADRTTCAHVRGRVVWRELHDPDGDGDRHLVLVSRLHTRIVKLPRDLDPDDPTPRLGTTVDASGWLIRGASGHIEIDTLSLRWGAGAGG